LIAAAEQRRSPGVGFGGSAMRARMEKIQMLGWALTFLVVALIAGVLGFTTIAGAAIGIAKIAFYVFLILFVVSLIMNFVRGRGTSL
jgi:uncharacterized membrane protein YtjA (UPF0391 family)